jgi:hypothetical protein
MDLSRLVIATCVPLGAYHGQRDNIQEEEQGTQQLETEFLFRNSLERERKTNKSILPILVYIRNKGKHIWAQILRVFFCSSDLTDCFKINGSHLPLDNCDSTHLKYRTTKLAMSFLSSPAHLSLSVFKGSFVIMDSTSPNRGGKNGINKLCLVVFSYFHVVYKKEKKKRVAHNETAAAYADPIRTITILIW